MPEHIGPTYHNSKTHNLILHITHTTMLHTLRGETTWKYCTLPTALSSVIQGFMEFGTKEFLKQLGSQRGTLYLLPEGNSSYLGYRTCEGSVTTLFACHRTDRSYICWRSWWSLLPVTFMTVCIRRASLVLTCAARLPYRADIPYHEWWQDYEPLLIWDQKPSPWFYKHVRYPIFVTGIW